LLPATPVLLGTSCPSPCGPAAAPLLAPASCLRAQDRCLGPLGHLSAVRRVVVSLQPATPVLLGTSCPSPCGLAAAPLLAPASCLRAQDRCLEPLGHLSAVRRVVVSLLPATPVLLAAVAAVRGRQPRP
jgi:hypothetical protein